MLMKSLAMKERPKNVNKTPTYNMQTACFCCGERVEGVQRVFYHNTLNIVQMDIFIVKLVKDSLGGWAEDVFSYFHDQVYRVTG